MKAFLVFHLSCVEVKGLRTLTQPLMAKTKLAAVYLYTGFSLRASLCFLFSVFN